MDTPLHIWKNDLSDIGNGVPCVVYFFFCSQCGHVLEVNLSGVGSDWTAQHIEGHLTENKSLQTTR